MATPPYNLPTPIPEPYQDPLTSALNFPGMPVPNTNSPPLRPEIPRQPWPPISPQNPIYNNPALQQRLYNNPYDTAEYRRRMQMEDLPGIPNLPTQGMPKLPPLQGQFNNPNNRAMPAGSMQSPFPGGNQPMARPSGRPKLPDPPQPPRQQQGTPPQRGPFGQPFGERQY